MNTQIWQQKTLVAETQRQTLRLQNQLEEARKRAESCNQQGRNPVGAPAEPAALSLTRAGGTGEHPAGSQTLAAKDVAQNKVRGVEKRASEVGGAAG